MLFPISKTFSLEGVLRDPGLFGVAGLEVLAESLLENISASRFRECLNCDSEIRLYAQENDKISRRCTTSYLYRRFTLITKRVEKGWNSERKKDVYLYIQWKMLRDTSESATCWNLRRRKCQYCGKVVCWYWQEARVSAYAIWQQVFRAIYFHNVHAYTTLIRCGSTRLVKPKWVKLGWHKHVGMYTYKYAI